MVYRSRRVAFLFLGETLLIPHLFPIVVALARSRPDVEVDCWIATSVHQTLLLKWLTDEDLIDRVRLRRVPGFLDLPDFPEGGNPPLPPKIATLARLVPRLLSARVVVCAELTSLWIPRVLPFMRWRFVKAAHGAGSMMARTDPRRRVAHRLLVPAPAEKQRLVSLGIRPERVEVVGYVKAAFNASVGRARLFDDTRPVLLYAPHWQQWRSSWWRWGPQIVSMLANQSRFNVILAPHQRLVEKAPAIRAILEPLGHLPHVHVDLGSFATVDGSYIEAADIYLGDTSSQVVEFMRRPRPCVFLNAQGVDWRSTGDHGFWECGEVVDRLEALEGALDRACAGNDRFEAVQRDFAAQMLGDTSGAAAQRAAAVVASCL